MNETIEFSSIPMPMVENGAALCLSSRDDLACSFSKFVRKKKTGSLDAEREDVKEKRRAFDINGVWGRKNIAPFSIRRRTEKTKKNSLAQSSDLFLWRDRPVSVAWRHERILSAQFSCLQHFSGHPGNILITQWNQ